MKTVIHSILLGTLLFSSSAFSFRDCKTERGLTVSQQLASLDPKTDLDLLGLDLFPGGSFTAGYEYKVEPAFTKGLYFRTDRWGISTKAIPGDVSSLDNNIDLSFEGGLKHQVEGTFIRSFSDPCRAMLSAPYSPRRIPLNVKTALGEKFNVGDYFFFRASLGFVVSGELLGMLGNAWGISLGASYLLEGHYQLHIVRLDSTHVRLKIIAHRGRDTVGSVGVGYESEFEVFKVGVLDKGLGKFIELKPIKVSANHSADKVMIVDYILDLTDEKVAMAFEALIRKVKNFKSLGLIAPFKNEKEIEANMIMDLSSLEDIYREDFNNNQIKRIKRNLRASSNQTSYGFGLKLGNKIIGYKFHGDVATSRMSVRKPDDDMDHYLLRSWDNKSDSRLFYSWYRSSEDKGLRALFQADSDYRITTPVNLIHHHQMKKNRINFKDMEKVKLIIKKALPEDIGSEIPWSNWSQGPEDKFTNFGLRMQLVFGPELIMDAPELSREEIVTLYKDHLRSKGLVSKDFFQPRKMGGRDTVIMSSEAQYNSSIRSLAHLFSRVLDREEDLLERLDAFTSLRKNKIFSETGFSFILALRPDKQKDWFHLNLNISSNESQVDFDYGNTSISSLYKKLLTVKAALDDEGLDLLREAESISIPHSLKPQ